MKKLLYRKLFVFFFLLTTCFCANAFAVPACPGFRTYQQPDGSSVRLELKGDEFFHWMRTEAGKIVVKNKSNGYFEYARIESVDGEEVLAPSGVVVREGPNESSSFQEIPSISAGDLGRIWKAKREKRRLLMKSPE